MYDPNGKSAERRDLTEAIALATAVEAALMSIDACISAYTTIRSSHYICMQSLTYSAQRVLWQAASNLQLTADWYRDDGHNAGLSRVRRLLWRRQMQIQLS